MIHSVHAYRRAFHHARPVSYSGLSVCDLRSQLAQEPTMSTSEESSSDEECIRLSDANDSKSGQNSHWISRDDGDTVR